MKQLIHRLSCREDEPFLIDWLLEPDTLRWFPMFTPQEVREAARLWILNAERRAAWTFLIDDKPCGMACLELSPYKKCAHQALMAIIVRKDVRGKGVGREMIERIKGFALELGITLLHLEVYEGNPAQRLYERMGFKQYGVHKKFLRDPSGGYANKILMQLNLE